MIFSSFALMKLAEMICGDVEHFPYRSSSNLTMFFESLDFQHVHDGTTRRYWVKDLLEEHNSQKSSDERFPSPNLTKIIEYIVHPEHFLGNGNLSQDAAVHDLNALLRIEDLKLVPINKGRFGVRAIADVPITDNVSTAETEKGLFCAPTVFQTPKETPNRDKQIAVIMPFAAGFNDTLDAIESAVNQTAFSCVRADQVWQTPTFIQDIFNLIYSSQIIVADLTGRNPNVMYELGIAHTLGRDVIPIAQSIADLSSNISHHRMLVYLPNREGFDQLSHRLLSILKSLVSQSG